MSIPNNLEKITSTKVKTIDETNISPNVFESRATGNESIIILNHKFSQKIDKVKKRSLRVVLIIKNISDSTISNLEFEAKFFGIDGDLLDIVKTTVSELKPNVSRAVSVVFSKVGATLPKSYDICISKMTTTDVEKVHIRQHGIRTTEAGEEEIWGIVKNISNTKTDVALIASFFDADNQKIGTKIIFLRGIEPNEIRKFQFLYKPQPGEFVRAHTLSVTNDIEEY